MTQRLWIASLGLMLLGLFAENGLTQTYRVLHSFSGQDGWGPESDLLLSGTSLYGATAYGGAANLGTLFKINTDGSGFTVLYQLTNAMDGANPKGSMAVSGGTLYGATSGGGGGSGGGGTVFKINTDGSGHTVLWRVDGSSYGGVLLSDSTLYCTTIGGGSRGWGTVFRLNTDGSGFAYLRQFTSADGPWPFWPEGNVILGGGTLYGTTSGGGSSDYGTVFKVNTDGTGYAVVKDMCCDGPFGTLAFSDARLYGTTGNMNGPGTVFCVGTNGSGYATLKQFNTRDGAGPLARLLVSGTTLYGATGGGGISNAGVVFQMDTTGGNYTVLKEFLGSDGSGPIAGFALSGTTLFGTTAWGGSSNAGVVFALGYPPSTPTPPRSQTAEAGATVHLVTHTADEASMKYQWFLNAINPISGGTNCDLLLTDVQLPQSGSYRVVLSNLFGAATSLPAALSVIPPVPRKTVPVVLLAGNTGSDLHLMCADRLRGEVSWQEVSAVVLTGPQQLYPDLTDPLPSARFYRAWQTDAPNAPPTLQMALATELTLTGAIGSHVRVDYINQFGPTDAWVTLATVTLTNSSQLYFDVSAPGQPERLYRLVPSP